MAQRKRRPKNPTPPQQRHAQPKIRRPLLILLIGAGIIGFILAGLAFYSQVQRPKVQAAQLATLEQRVNSETVWGRKVNQWIEQQHTSITADTSILSAMQYVVSRDTILINPDRYLTTEQLVNDARNGYLNLFMMRFHEELHRSQEMKSKWGELWRFLHQTNQMDK